MPAAAEATLTDETGKSVLRFERSFPQSAETLWAALTEADRQRAWHPTPFEFEPRVGGAVRYLAHGDMPDMPDGEVKAYDPPRVFAYTWDEDLLRCEIQPQEDGCLLVLTHTFADRLKAARDAAGWHVCLAALKRSLDERTTSDGAGSDDWRELNSSYQRRFGIDPAEATPPPEF